MLKINITKNILKLLILSVLFLVTSNQAYALTGIAERSVIKASPLMRHALQHRLNKTAYLYAPQQNYHNSHNVYQSPKLPHLIQKIKIAFDYLSETPAKAIVQSE